MTHNPVQEHASSRARTGHGRQEPPGRGGLHQGAAPGRGLARRPGAGRRPLLAPLPPQPQPHLAEPGVRGPLPDLHAAEPTTPTRTLHSFISSKCFFLLFVVIFLRDNVTRRTSRETNGKRYNYSQHHPDI